jgi:hypothetical protein
MAPTLVQTPVATDGEETWLMNNCHGYKRRLPRALEEWTRWFNLHSRQHQVATYPSDYIWYQEQDGTRPIYLQKINSTIPGSVVFPWQELLDHFKVRYFVGTITWLLAFAIYLGFERIELYGIEVRADKQEYAFERPAVAYWLEVAKRAGIEVYSPPGALEPGPPGDPSTYVGPLYGFETKPEKP